MKTTVQFLDGVRARYGLTSDYQLAQMLGLDRQAISHYRKGRTLGDGTAIKIAELLKLPAVYVLACMAAERAGTIETRNAWSKAAKALAGSTIAVLVGCTVIAAGPGAFDITTSVTQSPLQVIDNIHYAQFAQVILAHSTSVKSALCALLFAWMLKTCSARCR